MVESTEPPKSKTKFEYLHDLVEDKQKEKWEKEQNALKAMLEIEDRHDWVFDQESSENTTLKRVAAVDISYSCTNSQNAVAALIIMEFPTMKVLYEDYEQDQTEYPYLPGFLAFKEVPSYKVLFSRLKEKRPDLWPDLLLVDGNGVLHTRGFGCASHVGVVFDIPSIGVGKTVFAVDGLTQKGVKALSEQNLKKGGDVVKLTGESGKVWGAAYRATDEAKNPLIISIGHRVSLETSLACTAACIGKFKIPEPIRQADLRSREKVKEIYDKPKSK